MFGQEDDQTNNNQAQDQPVDTAPVTGGDTQPSDAGLPTPTFQPDPSTAVADPSTDDAAPSDNESWQHPGVPIDTPGPGVDVISPAGGFPRPTPMPSNDAPAPSGASSATDDDKVHELLGIKQEALQKLMPIIDDLEQTPEEHFRTLMMMIQASDDDNLVPKAYEAANAIEDEHTRAQALLDIVNEINYFTQPHEPEA